MLRPKQLLLSPKRRFRSQDRNMLIRGPCTGFTLVELVFVLTIIAIMASVAVIALGPIRERSRLQRAVDSVSRLDSIARLDSRRSNLASLLSLGDELRVQTSFQTRRRSWPPSVEIETKRVGFANRTIGSVASVPFDASGRSPSYGLGLRSGKQRVYVMILGLSGQVIQTRSQSEFDQWFPR